MDGMLTMGQTCQSSGQVMSMPGGPPAQSRPKTQEPLLQRLKEDPYYWAGSHGDGKRETGNAMALESNHAVHPIQQRRSGRPVVQQIGLRSLINKVARNIPGFKLVTVIIGKNPITGDPVPRTAENLFGGFLSLVPGGAALFDSLKKSGALSAAFTWLKKQIRILNISWSGIKALIARAWDKMSIWKGISGNYKILKNTFGPLFRRIRNFASSLWSKVKEFIFRGVLKMVGAPVERVMGFINRGKGVLMSIIRNPIRFGKNLINAVLAGFNLFKKNFATYMVTAVGGWLFGALAGAGIELPKKFNIKGIFLLVAQLLSLTYQSIRTKVVKRLGPRGEKIVSTLEKTVTFVKDLVTRGAAALWEKVKEKLTNLKQLVFGTLIDWLKRTVIGKAVIKILSMFNPAGALLQIALAIKNVVMFFLERYEQIKMLVAAVARSIAFVVPGKVSQAGAWIAKAMVKGLSVIISFLARLIGLGGISEKIKAIIKKVSKPVGNVIKKVVGWIVKKGKALLRRGVGAVKKGAAKIKNIIFPKLPFKEPDGKTHNLTVSKNGKFVIQSNEETVTYYLQKLSGRINNMSDGTAKTESQNALKEARDLRKLSHNDLESVLKSDRSKKKNLDKFTRNSRKLLGRIRLIWKHLGADKRVDLKGGELKVGLYGSLPTGNGKEVHHIPSNKFMEKFSSWINDDFLNVKTPKTKTKREGELAPLEVDAMRKYKTKLGVSIVMEKLRHTATRTYGGRAAPVRNNPKEYVALMQSEIKNDRDDVSKIYAGKKGLPGVSKKNHNLLTRELRRVKDLNKEKWGA